LGGVTQCNLISKTRLGQHCNYIIRVIQMDLEF
jgi:hypothetical protein